MSSVGHIITLYAKPAKPPPIIPIIINELILGYSLFEKEFQNKYNKFIFLVNTMIWSCILRIINVKKALIFFINTKN